MINSLYTLFHKNKGFFNDSNDGFEKKYTILPNKSTRPFYHKTLDANRGEPLPYCYRIRATRDIYDSEGFLVARKGELGGYIQDQHNLSQTDGAWIYPNGIVWGDAKVSGHATVGNPHKCKHFTIVGENAKIMGSASVEDDAVIHGNAIVKDEAIVCCGAIIDENATICDNAEVERATVHGNAIIGDLTELNEANITVGGDTKLMFWEKRLHLSEEYGDLNSIGLLQNPSDIVTIRNFILDSAYLATGSEKITIHYNRASRILWSRSFTFGSMSLTKFKDTILADEDYKLKRPYDYKRMENLYNFLSVI